MPEAGQRFVGGGEEALSLGVGREWEVGLSVIADFRFPTGGERGADGRIRRDGSDVYRVRVSLHERLALLLLHSSVGGVPAGSCWSFEGKRGSVAGRGDGLAVVDDCKRLDGLVKAGLGADDAVGKGDFDERTIADRDGTAFNGGGPGGIRRLAGGGLDECPFRPEEREILGPGKEPAERDWEVTPRDTGGTETGVEEFIPLGGPELAELEDLEKVDVAEGEIHEERGMGHGTVEVGEAGERAGGAPLCEDFGGPGGGGGLVGVHRSDAQRADDSVGAENVDVAVIFGPGLLAGTDGVAVRAGLAGGAKGVLRRGVNLALELEEIGDVKVFGLHPLQKGLVVGWGAGEVDMIVAGEPALGGWVPAGEGNGNGFGFTWLEGELNGHGGEEEAAMGLEGVIARRELEGGLAGEKDEMRLAVVGNFERLRDGSPAPKGIAVEGVHFDWENGIDRMEPEGAAVLQEIDAGGMVGADGEGGFELRLAELGESESEGERGEHPQAGHGDTLCDFGERGAEVP